MTARRVPRVSVLSRADHDDLRALCALWGGRFAGPVATDCRPDLGPALESLARLVTAPRRRRVPCPQPRRIDR